MPKPRRLKPSTILFTACLLSCDGGPPPTTLPRHSDQRARATTSGSVEISDGHAPEPGIRGSNSSNRLAASRILGGPDTFGQVQEIRPVGNYLVVTDPRGVPHITLFDRSSGTIIRRFGNDGRGPREFRGVYWLFTESHEPPRVWLYDYMLRRASLLDLDAPDSLMVADQFNVEVAASINSPAILGDTIVAGGLYPDIALLVMTRNQKVVKTVTGNLPFTEHDTEVDVALLQLNQNSTAFDPSRTRTAIAYQWANLIDLFEIDGTHYASASSPRDYPRPKYRFARDGSFLWEDETMIGWVDVAASDRYVYALYRGQLIHAEPERLSCRVDVFTWNGKYVTELMLDRELTEIAVSEDDATLYGAAWEPFPVVVEWELPAWLRQGVAF